MKKLILLSSAMLLLFSEAFSHGVTFNDLQYLLSGKDNLRFLQKKSYKVRPNAPGAAGPVFTYYVEQGGSMNADMIFTGTGFKSKDGPSGREVCYMTYNAERVEQIKKDIRSAGFKLTSSQKDPKTLFFRFEKKNGYVLVYQRQGKFKSEIILRQSS